jgi:hypothetical protein
MSIVVSTVWPVRWAAFRLKQVAAAQSAEEVETAGGAATYFLQ